LVDEVIADLVNRNGIPICRPRARLSRWSRWIGKAGLSRNNPRRSVVSRPDVNENGEKRMRILKTGAATLALIAAGSLGAMAADYSSGVTPQTPGTKPTTVLPSPDQGASSGEVGTSPSSPAGIPADPTTNENVQPGPSSNTPNDPAAGSNPGARIPTSPAGTGTSSP
jgi:hypothetical protein